MTKGIYADDEMLMLSGIQHFMFCPRQWALIHIEQLWADNELTAAGHVIHRNVDNSSYRILNNGKITYRSIHVSSKRLGFYGICDAIELIPTNPSDGIQIVGRKGFFIPYPIEYKHGKPKSDNFDIMQLVLQSLCIEEMYDIQITEGYLFYHTTMKRIPVKITESLRDKAYNIAEQMHRLFQNKQNPKAQYSDKCKKCSLLDLCLPSIPDLQNANDYLRSMLYEKTS